MDEKDIEIEANWALVVRGAYQDFASVLNFIKEQTNLQIIYKTGSVGKLFIVREEEMEK